MENSPSFEDAIKFSAKGIFGEKAKAPKDSELDPETVELFAKINPEKPEESVRAIESLIDRIGKNEALTLEQVKDLGGEISTLEKKFEQDVERYDSKFEKYPTLVKAEAWIRWVSGLNIGLKEGDVIDAKNLLDKSKLADSSAYSLGKDKFHLEEKIDEVIIVESAIAVPEFQKLVLEGQNLKNILTELDFLITYTEGQTSHGIDIAFSPKPSVISMIASDVITGVRNEKVMASVERLKLLMGEEKNILETSLPHSTLSILTGLDDQTSLINIASVFGEGISLSNSASSKKVELENLRNGYRARSEKIVATTNDVVTKVRKDLGLGQYKNQKK